jgi:hypothetical protein
MNISDCEAKSCRNYQHIDFLNITRCPNFHFKIKVSKIDLCVSLQEKINKNVNDGSCIHLPPVKITILIYHRHELVDLVIYLFVLHY